MAKNITKPVGVAEQANAPALADEPHGHKAREGWAEASRALAEAGDDALVMGEFANADDEEINECRRQSRIVAADRDHESRIMDWIEENADCRGWE